MEITSNPHKPMHRSGRLKIIPNLLPYVKYFLLPALASVFPTLFYYANNVQKLTLPYLARPALMYLSISIVLYLFFLVLYRKGPLKAANATLIFLVFFNLYSHLEGLLIRLDWFPVRFYTTLPLTLVIIFYSIWLLNKLDLQTALKVWQLAVVFFVALVVINLVKVIPAELAKRQEASGQPLSEIVQSQSVNQDNPDIFYIIFDEFSGFKPMREYWHNPKVDEFASFLRSRGFEIMEESSSSDTNTIHQIASRLNYHNLPSSGDTDSDMKQWYEAFADNLVLKYLKQIGYTSIIFNPFQFPSLSSKTIQSDVTYKTEDVPSTALSVYFDEFWILVADNTMLKELSPIYKKLGTDSHSNFIFFTTKRVGDLGDVPSPKFVYAHLMFPHSPYLFDENGNQNFPNAYTDNAYYLGNYNFSITVAQQLVDNILDGADPENPPVIILQSDHGFRNFSESNGFTGQFPDFPEEYKTSILYALYLPGYEPTYSPQESDPINTFPIVFNHLFDAGIPLQ